MLSSHLLLGVFNYSTFSVFSINGIIETILKKPITFKRVVRERLEG